MRRGTRAKTGEDGACLPGERQAIKAERSDNLVTVEMYRDVLHTDMIGAVYLDEKRLVENVELVGKAVCKARQLNVVECVILNGDGDITDQMIVYRGR